tara:strand:- start:868 stop:1338 length:471 start_codon:yes stop_codon:yes gene_type:complete
MLYKKAQVGETMTWVVATVIIIVILLFSIFIASIKPGKDKDISKLPDKQSDLLAKKSLVAYLSTGDVYNKLRNSEKFDDTEEGLLAEKIFKEFYPHEKYNIWVGLIIGDDIANNKYFDERETTSGLEDIQRLGLNYITEDIQLNKNLKLELGRKND